MLCNNCKKNKQTINKQAIKLHRCTADFVWCPTSPVFMFHVLCTHICTSMGAHTQGGPWLTLVIIPSLFHLLKSYYLRTPSLTFEDKITGRPSWAPGIYRVLETNPSVLTGWKKMAATARGKPDEMILSCHLLMALGTQQQWSCFGNWKPIHWSTSGNFENSCDLEQIREYIYKMVTITYLVRLF